MQRTFVVLVAAVAAAAPALAGDASNPEITDPPNDAAAGLAWGDITSGWLNDTASDLVVTMQLATLAPAAPPNYIYYFVADVGTGDNATYGCFAFNDAGSWSFGCAHWDRSVGPTDDLDGTGTVTPGQPGTVVLNLPRAVAGSPSAGTTISSIEVGTGSGAFVPAPTPVPIGQFVQDDIAQATRDYVLALGPGAPGGPSTQGPGNATGNATSNMTGEAPPPPRTPGFEAPLALAAVGVVALAVARRRA